jgi:MFS family permease
MTGSGRDVRFIKSGRPLLLFVCLVVFLDTLGYGVVVAVLPLHAKELGVTDFGNGFLFAIYAIALLAGAIPAGVLSDRFGRKPFILFGMFVNAGAFLVYAIAQGYWLLAAARTLDGLTAAATWSAGLALIGDRFKESEMGSKMGYAGGAMAVGGIVGPLLGGILYDAIGYQLPFLTIAGACLAGGLTAMFLSENRSGPGTAGKSALRMLRTVVGNRTVMIACMVTVVSTTGIGLLEPTLPVYLKDRFSLSSANIGLFFCVMSLCYAVAGPLAGRVSDHIGRKKPVIAGLVAAALAAPLLVVAGNLGAMFILIGIVGAALAVFETPSLALVTDSLSQDGDGGNLYGTAFGLLNLFWGLGYALGPLAGGAVMDQVSLPVAMCCYSALLLVVTALVIRWLE